MGKERHWFPIDIDADQINQAELIAGVKVEDVVESAVDEWVEEIIANQPPGEG